MNYRVVYDVLDESLVAGQHPGLIFLAAALVWTTVWIVIHRRARGMPPERRRNWRAGAVVGGLFLVLALVTVLRGTYPMYADRKQCREWLRAGDHETVEGPIAQFRREAGRSPPRHFRVGDVAFTYRTESPRTGGFRGAFTAPGTEGLTLTDGQLVRIAHRDGRILRIELAE